MGRGNLCSPCKFSAFYCLFLYDVCGCFYYYINWFYFAAVCGDWAAGISIIWII